MARTNGAVAEGTISDVATERQDEVRKLILDAKDRIGMTNVDLYEWLYEVKHGGYFTKYGFESFDEYAEKEVRFHYRKAQHFVQIQEVFVVEHHVGREDLKDIDWSKLVKIVPHVTKKNVDAWLRKAREFTQEQLSEAIRNASGGDNEPGSGDGEPGGGSGERPSDAGPDEALVTFKVKMRQEQLDNVNRALTHGKGFLKTTSLGHVLDMMALDFVNTYADEEEGALILFTRQVEELKRAWKLKDLVIDFGDNTILKEQYETRADDRERVKKAVAASGGKRRKAAAGDTVDPASGDDIDPETGEPKKQRSKKKKAASK